MFKFIVLAIFCLTVPPVIQPSQAVTNSPNLILTDANTDQTQKSVEREQYRDSMGRKRSPESIERQRNRKRSAYQKQLNWRRKYGDLAPSRQTK